MAICRDDDGAMGDGDQCFAGFCVVDPYEPDDRHFKFPNCVATESTIFAGEYRRDLRGFPRLASLQLAHAAIEGLSRAFGQGDTRLTVVSQNHQIPGDIALCRRDTVQGVAAAEQDQRARFDIQTDWH